MQKICWLITMHAVQVKHMQGDRQDFEKLKSKLAGAGFDVVYDINGRHLFILCFLLLEYKKLPNDYL